MSSLAFVQARAATGQTGPTSLAYTSPLTALSSGICVIGYTVNGVVPTIVQTANNVFTLIKRYLGASLNGVDIWLANGMVAGAGTVQVTWSSGKANIGIGILEYQPTPGYVLALDQENAVSDGTHVTSFPHGSITTLFPVELILTAGRLNQQIVAPAGYTARINPVGANSVSSVDRITSTTETTNPTPTGAIATGYSGAVVSLYEVPDPSAIRLTQQVRRTLEVESVVKARLNQMVRKVLFEFTVCNAQPPNATRITQLPLEVAYDYADLDPFVKGTGQLWRTPPPTLP